LEDHVQNILDAIRAADTSSEEFATIELPDYYLQTTFRP